MNLVGRYEVVRVLGRGGMAVVHLARQPDLQRLVALKEMRALRGEDPALAQRFLREARLAGSLTDPHVVTVYEYFEHDGVPFMAMEYAERGPLRPFVGELNLPQIAGVLESVLAGLSAAEQAGIVHRDLKPENVLVSADGRAKIADFGIAKATTALGAGTLQTATGMMIGTPAYMAPEQAMGTDIGPWTDLYSTGCLAYELLTGQRPFHDVEAPMAILMRHATEPIPPASAIVPDLDPRLSDWVARLVEKDRRRRPPSAAAAWDELEEIVVDLLGPRWRRDARVLHQPGDAPVTDDAAPPLAMTAKPYTPPPPDLPPGPLAPAARDEDAGTGPGDEPRVAAGDDAPAGATAAPGRDAPAPPPHDGAAASPRRAARRWPFAVAGLVALAAIVGAVLLLGGDGEDGVPVDSLTANPSFESGTGGWEAFQGTITREAAGDAPDGGHVVRVTSTIDGDQYAIDDEPDTVVTDSVQGRHYTASAWIKAAEGTDGKPVCIALREWAPGTDAGSAAIAEGKVTASSGEWQRVTASFVATADGNTIDVHVYRWADDVTAGEAFLADAVVLAADDAGGPNDQLVSEARCA